MNKNTNDINEAIISIASNLNYFTNKFKELFEVKNQSTINLVDQDKEEISRTKSTFKLLTEKQIKVLLCIMIGKSNEDICEALGGISESTVKAHVRTLMDKFDTRKRTILAHKNNFLFDHMTKEESITCTKGIPRYWWKKN